MRERFFSKKWVSRFAALFCMMMLVLSMTVQAAETTKFSYAYDCYRTPTMPAIGGSVKVYNFGNPLVKPGKNGSQSGNWSLVKLGSYQKKYEDGKGYYSTQSLVNGIANKSGISSASVDVYELKKDGSHICYGVVPAMSSNEVFFIGTTYSQGAGYVLSNVKESGEIKFEKASQTANTSKPNNDQFSLLDITPEHVSAGVYAEDSNGVEMILTMFHDNAGANYISMMAYGNMDNSSEIICGEYNDQNTKTWDDAATGYTWTSFDIKDVYTGNAYTLTFAEGNDGRVFLVYGNNDKIEGSYLSNEDTVNYMGSFVALIQ